MITKDVGTISALALASVLVSPLLAQTPAREPVAQPAFAVATVRPNHSGGSLARFSVLPDGLIVQNQRLRNILASAYGVSTAFVPQKFSGGPDRILSASFDIQAKAPKGTPPDQILLMLRSLLAERFKLRIHTESRPTPVYALVLRRSGALGPELRRSDHDCAVRRALLRAEGGEPKAPVDAALLLRDAKNRPVCGFLEGGTPPPRGAWRIRYAGHLSELIASAQGFVDRPIVDATGLTGTFEWQVDFNPLPIPRPEDDLPSVYTAFEHQLGLTLRPRTMPFEVFVVDAVESPIPD